jgi:hypothetical protein
VIFFSVFPVVASLLATQEGYCIIFKWQQVFIPGSQVEKLVKKNATKLKCGEKFFLI